MRSHEERCLSPTDPAALMSFPEGAEIEAVEVFGELEVGPPGSSDPREPSPVVHDALVVLA
jgi:hypothetical protein